MNGANVAWSGVVYAFIYMIQFGVLTAKKIVARAHAKSRTANLSDIFFYYTYTKTINPITEQLN